VTSNDRWLIGDATVCSPSFVSSMHPTPRAQQFDVRLKDPLGGRELQRTVRLRE
jgi:hypothetical protein